MTGTCRQAFLQPYLGPLALPPAQGIVAVTAGWDGGIIMLAPGDVMLGEVQGVVMVPAEGTVATTGQYAIQGHLLLQPGVTVLEVVVHRNQSSW